MKDEEMRWGNFDLYADVANQYERECQTASSKEEKRRAVRSFATRKG